MDDDEFRGDCGRCVGLCCVALAFDRGPLFAFDKPAGTPCPHLDGDARCGIHAERAARGFAGCVGYDCLGAGQRTTRMFAGLDWRDKPAVARAMFAAFAVLRRVQALRLAARRAGTEEPPEPPESYAGLLQLELSGRMALRADEGTGAHSVPKRRG